MMYMPLKGFKEDNCMKKQIIALVLCAAAVFFVSVPTKADVALDYANNQNNMQNAWLNQQWNYYNTYQQPVLNVYGQVITNQYSQGLAAQYQALSMQQMMLDKARADAFQIAANRFAHTTNMMTQMIVPRVRLKKNMPIEGSIQIQIALKPSGLPETRKKENIPMTSAANRILAIRLPTVPSMTKMMLIPHRTANTAVQTVKSPLWVATFMMVMTRATRPKEE